MSQTEKQMAAGQRRSLMAIRKKLLAMSCEWEDVDGYNESVLEQLADKVQEVSDGLVVEQ